MTIAAPPPPLKKVTPSKSWGPVKPPPPNFLKIWLKAQPSLPLQKGGGCTLWRITFFYNLNKISYIHVWEEMFWVWRSSSLEKFIQFIISKINIFYRSYPGLELCESFIVIQFFEADIVERFSVWRTFPS